MTAMQNDRAEISAGQVLPQLFVKRAIPAQGVLSPPHASRQRQMARQARLSSVAGNVPCTDMVKSSLYFWTVLAILLGLMLPCFVLYLMYFKQGGGFVPMLPFKIAAYSGLGVSIAAGIGLYGLLRHRDCVTKGSRNYALGMFIALGTAAAILLIVAAAMSFSLARVVALTEQEHILSEQVVLFETTLITRLQTRVKEDKSGWQDLQNQLSCCGYDRVGTMQAKTLSSSAWDPALVAAVNDANSVAGRYCSSRPSDCESSDAHCPVSGREWCRTELLQIAYRGYSQLGVCAIVLGLVQLLFSAFGLVTLLCDVRRRSGWSPTIRMQHQTLSPIQVNTDYNAH